MDAVDSNRLDGTTQSTTRQEAANAFNKAQASPPAPTNPYAERAISNFGSTLIPQLTRIFAIHSSSDGRWHRSDLIRFLGASSQADAATTSSEELEAVADAIFAESHGHRLLTYPAAGTATAAEEPTLDLKGFLEYMASAAAQVEAPPHADMTDLSWPLTSYFISSSHNTYLTGNQLYGDSSTDAYTNVLLRGCRCIEVDVWDGDESDVESVSSASTSGDGRTGSGKKAKKQPHMLEDEPDISKEEKKRRKKERKEQEKYGVGPDEEKRKKESIKAWAKLKDKLDKVSITGSGGGGSNGSGSGRGNASGGNKKNTNDSLATTETTPPPKAAVIEPQVFHGYTLTKEIPFRDVCYAVRDAAFVATDLPLVVSLETHCSPAQQERMAEIMKEAWAGMLVEVPDAGDGYGDAKMARLPSPGELRGKILVKCKYAPPLGEPGMLTSKGDDGGVVENDNDADDDEDAEEEEEEEQVQEATPKTAKAKPPAKVKVVQVLSRMGVYTRAVTFKSLSQPEASMPTHIFSLSEKRLLAVHEASPARLFEHNRRFLMRTYPSGMRISSSNLDPALFWRKGVQIVALNWQRWDEGTMLNEAMFSGTGGYVLKPAGYRALSDDEEKNMGRPRPPPQTQATAAQHKTLDLVIDVLAAQDIPLPKDVSRADRFEPYVKVELHISRPEDNLFPSDDATLQAPPGSSPNLTSIVGAAQGRVHEGEYKARTSVRRGTSPLFDGGGDNKTRGSNTAGGGGETLVFNNVPDVVAELAFVRFTVWDDDFGRDDVAAWACVRLDRLRTGYRFVPLRGMDGARTEGVLLVKISKVLR